eukprot:CAMPEP_0185259968 /NCGR_PEP_ID=MMETSP1359-20130426/8641_1 /TAXON_ID=552665 /ORGANISM="Bigelowiella longifila, Strain CCMP242" /LENGTH=163 /DNA_ID=CAMNT_0027846049 /DNA_START=193 /DNA_END=684 /DNA_ORIENTATION=+
MLAREYAEEKAKRRLVKPIILSHRMLPGLKQGQEKMSKSDPDSAIFMEDTRSEVNAKIKRAYCPPQIIEGNPVLEYARYLVLPRIQMLSITRRPQDGGNTTYHSWQALREDYDTGKLHPGDLKPAVASALNEILEPVRRHFRENKEARDLLASVKKYRRGRAK